MLCYLRETFPHLIEVEKWDRIRSSCVPKMLALAFRPFGILNGKLQGTIRWDGEGSTASWKCLVVNHRDRNVGPLDLISLKHCVSVRGVRLSLGIIWKGGVSCHFTVIEILFDYLISTISSEERNKTLINKAYGKLLSTFCFCFIVVSFCCIHGGGIP